MDIEELRNIKPVGREPETTISPFLRECCETDVTAITPNQTIYYRYVLWCKDNHKPPQSNKKFSIILLESGARRIRSNGSKWVGFRLKES